MTDMRTRHLHLAMDAATPTEEHLHRVAARAHQDAGQSVFHLLAARQATANAFDVRRGGTVLAADAGFSEGDHPRANNGQFGSGGGSASKTPHTDENARLRGEAGKSSEALNAAAKGKDKGAYELAHKNFTAAHEAVSKHWQEHGSKVQAETADWTTEHNKNANAGQHKATEAEHRGHAVAALKKGDAKTAQAHTNAADAHLVAWSKHKNGDVDAANHSQKARELSDRVNGKS